MSCGLAAVVLVAAGYAHYVQNQVGGDEAGQAFEIATVQAVTSVHIDHFLELNLAGFYNLAQAFGGIEACVKPAPAGGGFPAGANLTDRDVLTGTDNSGFNAYRDGYNRKKGGAQYLHLNARQSLAFVRSRDTLPGIDLGRTTRQQAVIDYVIWKLGHQGCSPVSASSPACWASPRSTSSLPATGTCSRSPTRCAR